MSPLEQIAKRRAELQAQKNAIERKLVELATAERVFRELGVDLGAGNSADAIPGSGVSADGRKERRIKVKTVVREILKAAYPDGLQAAEIRERARREQNIELNPNTLTVTLGRYKEKGMARIEGKTWFFVPPISGNDDAPPINAGEAS